MKFTILSHAGLLVETRGCSIVIDPWLVGSCYWRSWWNYPPPPQEVVTQLAPDYIYLTHLHWDHFHSPSLRRFNPKTPILVPRAHFDRMVRDLHSIGFQDVRELAHGARVRLKGNTAVSSYQFGLSLDSAFAIEADGVTLFNANDCKLMGLPLRAVAARHPRVDFVLKSHSSASPYPFCVSSEFQEHLRYRSNVDYLEEFLAFAEFLKAAVAIPFASNHCFLHKETKRFNETIVSPEEVKAYFDAHKRKATAACQPMLPGDSWSKEEGFRISPHDYFTNRTQRLKELETRCSDRLDRFYTQESRVQPDWESFRRYFEKLLASLPPGFGAILPARIVFHVVGNGSADWLVDFRRRKILPSVDPSAPWDIRVETSAYILKDCCQKRMFSVFTASKRVHYHLRTKPALRYLFIFNSVMDMYESEYFPVGLMLRGRFLTNWVRRWREILFYLTALSSAALRGKIPRPVEYLKSPA